MNKITKPKPILISIAFSLLAIALVSCAGGSGQVKTNWPEVAVDLENDTAYLSAGNFLHAINLSNGSEKWHFPAESDRNVSFYAAPAITPDFQVILVGYNHVIFSLDPAQGTENWRFSEAKNAFVASPLVTESGIYAPSSDNYLYALGHDGKLLWEPLETGEALWSSPVTDGDYIYLLSMNQHLHAIDIATGKELWESEPLGGSVAGKPALDANGVLYVGTISAEMLAIDGEDGDIIWRTPSDGWIWSGPLLEDGRLYYGDMEGSVYAVDSSNGAVIWRIQPDTGANRAVVGTPLIMGDTLYFGATSGILYAVNKSDGSPRWNKAFDGKLHFGPVDAGDLILLVPTGGDQLLIALDSNGNQVWAFSQK